MTLSAVGRRMLMVVRLAAASALGLLVTASAAPLPLQTQGAPSPQKPVFRSGTTVVPLTVTVLSRSGVPVTTLVAGDFTVFEDDRPREIVAFFPQALAPRAAPAGPAGRIERSQNDWLAVPSRRTFLIALGFGRIQHPTNALDGALRFVRGRLLPQDAVAVMAFHRVTTFTTNHEWIAGILERFKKEHERIVFEINQFRFMSHGRGMPPLPLPKTMLAAIDTDLFGEAVNGTAGDGEERLSIRNTADLLLGMDRATPIAEQPWQRQQTFKELMDQLTRSRQSLTDSVIMGTRLKLLAGIEYLRYVEGEKHMVFLAPGPIARSADDARIVAARANDARMVVDYIYTAGTSLYGLSGCPSCRDVAELTGGHYTSVDHADAALADVDSGSRASYLLGFAPARTVLDGKYHRIRVVVNRPDVVVRFKQGYYAAPEVDPIMLKTSIVKARVGAALAYDSAAEDIPVTVAAQLVPSTTRRPEVRVELAIDISPLVFQGEENGRRGEIELQVHCGDRREAVVGSLRERVQLRPTEATFAGWRQDGYRRTIVVPVTATPTYVKVVVYDYESDRVGSAVARLESPRK